MFDGLKAKKANAESLVNSKLDPVIAQVPEGPMKTPVTDIIRLVGTAAVTIVIVIFIISSIMDGMPAVSNSELNTTATNVISTFSSAMSLATVALIVIVAGAILYYVRGFGGGDNQGGMR